MKCFLVCTKSPGGLVGKAVTTFPSIRLHSCHPLLGLLFRQTKDTACLCCALLSSAMALFYRHVLGRLPTYVTPGCVQVLPTRINLNFCSFWLFLMVSTSPLHCIINMFSFFCFFCLFVCFWPLSLVFKFLDGKDFVLLTVAISASRRVSGMEQVLNK